MYLGELKPFQVEGSEFFLDRKQALVAYDMGLGKTHIAMASIEEEKLYPALIICPSYLKWKWADEIERWTDTKSYVVDGTPSKRNKIYVDIHDEQEPHYVLINYELLRKDYNIVKHFDFKVTVCDEVTAIKTYNSKTKKALKVLPESEYRLGLTGTPVSNKPDELFSIMDWIEPKLFGKWWKFNQRYIVRGVFNQVEKYVNLRELASIASERMITRKQEDVAEQLPDMLIEAIRVPSTSKQNKAYAEVASALKAWLETIHMAPNSRLIEAMVRQRFSALRQVCVCPKILEHSTSEYAPTIESSLDDFGSKVPAVLELIEEASDKVVVFSFYREVVDILSEELTRRGISHLIIKGNMKNKTAYDVSKEFEAGSHKVLLTTEAGDRGVDLQCAKYLINIDIPFSWEKYDQRLGRIKRIGSEHQKVFVYNILLRNSFEERMLNNTLRKGALADAIQGITDVDVVFPTEMTLREFLEATL